MQTSYNGNTFRKVCIAQAKVIMCIYKENSNNLPLQLWIFFAFPCPYKPLMTEAYQLYFLTLSVPSHCFPVVLRRPEISSLDSTVEPLLSGHLGFKGCPHLRFAHISECIQNSAAS